MDNSRRKDCIKKPWVLRDERGIALILAIFISIAVLLIVASIYYIITESQNTGKLNRSFSSTRDAANGGVDYALGIVENALTNYISTGQATPPASSGVRDSNAFATKIATGTAPGGCSPTDTNADIRVVDAQGNYTIYICVDPVSNFLPIPGSGGGLEFPPQKLSGAGGGGALATYQKFFRITAYARDSKTNAFTQVESLMRGAI